MKKKTTKTRTNSKSLPFSRKRLPLRFYGALEPLEAREVLAANILASAADSISAPGDEDPILMIVSTETPGATATLKLQLEATAGGSLDAVSPQVFDALGNEVVGMRINDAGGTMNATTLIDLGAGEYTVVAGGQRGTTGDYTISASLLGDVRSADSMVGEFERLLASAAMTQFLGTANFVTDLFYQTQGIDLGVDQYDAGMDANSDGVVDPSDFQLVEANAGIGVVNVEFIPDQSPPEISGLALVSDTGVSSTDRITSTAAISGTITDEREIVQIQASVDNGSLVDVTGTLVVGVDGSFTVSQALLDSLAGGTLADGAHTLNLSATDDLGNVIDPPAEFDFTLIRNNTAPDTSGIVDDAATEDAAYTYDIGALVSDNTGDVNTFTSDATLPSWLTLSSTGVLSGTPRNADVGSDLITITVTDFAGLTSTTSFTLTVVNTNDAPIVNSIPDQNAEEDAPFSLDINSFVSDPDAGDTLTISVDQTDGDANGIPINPVDLPAWLTYDETTGLLTGTPSDGDGGTITISVFAVDVVGESDVTSFNITVADRNDVPIFTGPIEDATIAEEQALNLDVSSFFSDADMGDTLTFSASADDGDLPAWLMLNSATGVFSGTADDADVGSVMIVVTATDSFNQSAVSNSFSLTVINLEEAPVVEDQQFRVRPSDANGTVVGTVVATDPDIGDVLTYAITGGSGASFFAIDSATGELTVADSASLNEGDTPQITVTVTDDIGLNDSAVVSFNITENDPPVAVDDTGFSTDDVLQLDIAATSLTQNDTDVDLDTLTITSVSGTTGQGATVTLSSDGNTVTYDPTTSSTLLSLNAGESMVDTFTYTISDGNGGSDTATVSVTVDGTGPDVQFILRTFDTAGNEVTAIDPGDTFELRVFTQDISGQDQGVFSAYLDVAFNVGLATPTGTIVHSSTYPSGTSGTIATGLIDEVGGVDGTSPLGGAEFEVFRLQFTAGSGDGLLTFNSNAADDQILHPVLQFGDSANTLIEQVVYGSTSIAIGSVAPLSGSNSTISNPINPYDVNGDTQVSPLDALLVINYINGINDGTGIYYDVNDDGIGSPLDALLVVNEMTSPTPAASITTGTINGDDGSSLAVDDLFAALGDDSIELGQPWGEVVDFIQQSTPELISEIQDHLNDLEDGEEIDNFNDWLLGLQGLL